MSRTQPSIGRAVLEILHYVTEHHPVTVREVADHVFETKGHVRTTVLNIMERLRKKGYLTRKKAGGLFQYSPRVPKTELLRNLVREFVSKALGGSVSPFVAYLADEATVSREEIAQLRKVIRELEKSEENK